MNDIYQFCVSLESRRRRSLLLVPEVQFKTEDSVRNLQKCLVWYKGQIGRKDAKYYDGLSFGYEKTQYE